MTGYVGHIESDSMVVYAEIVDEITAEVHGGIQLAAECITAIDLLWGEAQKAKLILENYVPAMTKKDYLAFQGNLFRTERYDGRTGTSEMVSKKL